MLMWDQTLLLMNQVFPAGQSLGEISFFIMVHYTYFPSRVEKIEKSKTLKKKICRMHRKKK